MSPGSENSNCKSLVSDGRDIGGASEVVASVIVEPREEETGDSSRGVVVDTNARFLTVTEKNGSILVRSKKNRGKNLGNDLRGH